MRVHSSVRLVAGTHKLILLLLLLLQLLHHQLLLLAGLGGRRADIAAGNLLLQRGDETGWWHNSSSRGRRRADGMQRVSRADRSSSSGGRRRRRGHARGRCGRCGGRVCADGRGLRRGMHGVDTHRQHNARRHRRLALGRRQAAALRQRLQTARLVLARHAGRGVAKEEAAAAHTSLVAGEVHAAARLFTGLSLVHVQDVDRRDAVGVGHGHVVDARGRDGANLGVELRLFHAERLHFGVSQLDLLLHRRRMLLVIHTDGMLVQALQRLELGVLCGQLLLQQLLAVLEELAQLQQHHPRAVVHNNAAVVVVLVRLHVEEAALWELAAAFVDEVLALKLGRDKLQQLCLPLQVLDLQLRRGAGHGKVHGAKVLDKINAQAGDGIHDFRHLLVAVLEVVRVCGGQLQQVLVAGKLRLGEKLLLRAVVAVLLLLVLLAQTDQLLHSRIILLLRLCDVLLEFDEFVLQRNEQLKRRLVRVFPLLLLRVKRVAGQDAASVCTRCALFRLLDDVVQHRANHVCEQKAVLRILESTRHVLALLQVLGRQLSKAIGVLGIEPRLGLDKLLQVIQERAVAAVLFLQLLQLLCEDRCFRRHAVLAGRVANQAAECQLGAGLLRQVGRELRREGAGALGRVHDALQKALQIRICRPPPDAHGWCVVNVVMCVLLWCVGAAVGGTAPPLAHSLLLLLLCDALRCFASLSLLLSREATTLRARRGLLSFPHLRERGRVRERGTCGQLAG
eukprot:m.171430 g.171430  ORF g.171430 m.171430 type:complete len:736 (-) comp17272_c0_seq2:59-2266(-)